MDDAHAPSRSPTRRMNESPFSQADTERKLGKQRLFLAATPAEDRESPQSATRASDLGLSPPAGQTCVRCCLPAISGP
jgi:hypothetical protein